MGKPILFSVYRIKYDFTSLWIVPAVHVHDVQIDRKSDVQTLQILFLVACDIRQSPPTHMYSYLAYECIFDGRGRAYEQCIEV